MFAQISKANDGVHKYKVEINNRIIRFGDIRFEDYTIHNNKARKISYIKRHIKNENWHDPMTKGFWSRWLLWNKPTILQSINSIEKLFGIKIFLK